ncbi:MAG: hypothetical protein KGY76_03420 [Candidatus Thermoplasmatota archaeon]|nr:hypothetical protein [Candidatus Thermoplasmatota archaeon]
MKEKFKKIEEAVQKATGKSVDLGSLETTSDIPEASLIGDVLLFSTSYDYFLVQEEGRLDSLIEDRFSVGDVRQPPKVDHVETEEQCREALKEREIDLLIVFGEPMDTSFEGFLSETEKAHEELPIVWISNDGSESLDRMDLSNLEEIFTWNGDGEIILTIIQYIEDKICFSKGDFDEHARVILLVEDSRQYYSTYLTHIYDRIWSYLDRIIHEGLTREKRIERYRRRPFVIHAEDVEEGRERYEELERDLSCVITDNRLKKNDRAEENAGLEFAEEIKEDRPELPVLLQSSSQIEEDMKNKDIEYVNKKAPDLNQKLIEFVDQRYTPTELAIKENDHLGGKSIETIREFEDEIKHLDEDELYELVKESELINWLINLTEFEIAENIETIAKSGVSPRRVKEEVLDALEEHRYASYSTAVTNFRRETDDLESRINRIGDGALGGKARGLAFISKLFSRFLNEELFEDLEITVPRTIVLTSDVFDKFLEENEIMDSSLLKRSDERISSKFIEGSLPATVIGDVRAFIRNTRNPLIVRSSGLLEDSMTRPFAGVYSSMFLPNESWETSLRFREVCDAIKHVYASTFFENARNYLRSTPKNIGDEKMSVILQEVVGKKYGKYFYPTISGVAKSYNHYPAKGCDPEDGIVYLALGLGKEIVEGGQSYFFCPECPKSPMFGTPKDFIPHSQTEFYALDLESVYRRVEKDEETSLANLDMKKAEKHRVLDKVASTYSPRDDRLYPGINREGSIVVDFAPIIKHGSIPLADAMKLLLEIAEIALGYPVEIEFAVKFEEDGNSAELVVLQIRNMVSKDMFLDIDIEKCDEEKLVCRSDKVLGSGMITEIRDVIYTKPDQFEMKNSERAAEEISEVNKRLLEEDEDYILIGPGRWGTTDHWMGIPVEWGDIAGAKVIVETPAEGRAIEPSQGSHFFHDMIASETCYLVVDDDETIDLEWLEKQQVEDEMEDIKHVRLEEPVEVRIDGKEGKGVIMKKVQKGAETNDDN